MKKILLILIMAFTFSSSAFALADGCYITGYNVSASGSFPLGTFFSAGGGQFRTSTSYSNRDNAYEPCGRTNNDVFIYISGTTQIFVYSKADVYGTVYAYNGFVSSISCPAGDTLTNGQCVSPPPPPACGEFQTLDTATNTCVDNISSSTPPSDPVCKSEYDSNFVEPWKMMTLINVIGAIDDNEWYSICNAESLNPAWSSIECTIIPICNSDVRLARGILNFGYHQDYYDNNQPKPDIDCPSTMVYYANSVDWDLDIKTCRPNPAILRPECEAGGGLYLEIGEYLDSEESAGAMAYGSGCSDRAYLANRAYTMNTSYLVMGLLPSINSAYLAKLGGAIFTGSKSFLKTVSDFFKSDPVASPQGLISYKPNFIDVQIQADGTYAVMNYDAQVYRAAVDLGLVDNIMPNNIGTTVNTIPDNLYVGNDIIKFDSSQIGTKSFLDDIVPLEIDPVFPLNTESYSTITLKDSLYGTTTKDFPLDQILISKATDTQGVVQTLTRSQIRYPDGSLTKVDTLLKTAIDNSKVYEITTSTPIFTPSGVKTFSKKVTITKDASGTTTNTIHDAPLVNFIDPTTGLPKTTTNTPDPIQTDTALPNFIDLSALIARINTLNKTATDTQNLLKSSFELSPANAVEATNKLNNFSSGLSDWTLGFDNAYNFINGVKNSLNGLYSDFDNAKAIFDNVPTVTVANGTCAFNYELMGKIVVVDPCLFISPYRSILTLLFTFFMSLYTVLFCIKYLFSVTPSGGK